MKKKLASLAAAMALTAVMGGTAMAAEGSLADVPKDHWSYEAVNQLVKDGIIEGMPDGTYAGDRAISRYEMAVIVARATDKMEQANIADRALIEKMQSEYDSELKTIKDDVADLKNKVGKLNFYGFMRAQYDHDDKDGKPLDRSNDRTYLDLRADYKVNDNWTVKTQVETHHRYSDDGSYNTGFSKYSQKTWSGHDGNIKRVWVEGNFANGGWVNIGRAWRGLGFQNVLLGTETDGIQAGIPIKGTGLTASAIYASGTGTGDKESIYGIGTWGSVGHCVDINLNYVKSDMSKGHSYSTGEIVAYKPGKPIPGASTAIVLGDPIYNTTTVKRDKAFVLSTGINVAKNVRLLNDYIQTNADDNNKSIATRINYKGTDLNDPGSFGLYARYFKYGSNGQIAGDDEWGSTPFGSKGWIVGVKYVPVKNVEWETLYSQQKCDYAGVDGAPFDRKLFRTQVDFHF